MNACHRFVWLVALLAATVTGRADGFIIAEGPLPGPGPHLPPRPYLFAPLEVTFHHVDVRIKDQVAVTSVDQEFYNPNDARLEGTYLFPLPTGAQIDKFAMEINGQLAEAELMAADKARRIYEDIVRKLKDPALLEYAGRDVFKVRIFPIEPHSKKHVRLSYTQVLKADSGLVSYPYPLNTEKFSAKPVREVSLKVELETRRPLKTIYSPSHNVEIRRHGTREATVGFEAKETKPDTDFQLYFAPEADDIGVNLLTCQAGSDDGYFLLLASPGVTAKDKQVVLKDVAFVLDTSGSMAGKKLEQAKKALEFCVDSLNDGDRFEVLRFSTDTEPLFNRLIDASAGNRARAGEFIKNLRALGGTAIDDALQKALALRPEKTDRPYVIVFLTDGMPTIGETGEDRIVGNTRAANTGNTRVFCFGLGNDVNTHLLDKLAEATRATSQYVLPDEDIEVKVSNFFTRIKEPVLANPRISFPDGVRVTKTYPSSLPDLFKGDQLVLAGRYAGNGGGKVVLEGTVNGVVRQFVYDLQFPGAAGGYDFIPRLWATRRVGSLLDEIRLHGENQELRDEVTALARQYAIVTPYTAYLIVDDEARRNVPVSAQTLPTLQAPADRLQERKVYEEFKDTRSGGGAALSSRYGVSLRTATSADAAINAGNQQALAMTPPPAGAGVAGTAPAAGRVYSRVAQAAQETRFVNGCTFYLNGSQWIDARVQKMANAPRVRFRLGSAEYFALLAKHPEALPWAALGRNVQFRLGESVCEVYE